MKVETLDEITLKIGSGVTPRGGQKTYKSKGISLIRSQNVYDFSFSKRGLAFISEEQAKKLNNVTVKSGDILLNITGDSIARTCLVPEEIIPARVNQHVSIIRCKEQYDSRYVNYYLIYLKPYLLQICGVGGTRNALTKEALQNLQIKIPYNQKQIAKVLSDLDAKIEVNNKINQELEAMAKLVYDYWFVQFDFPMSKDYANAIGKPELAGKPYKSSGGKMVYNSELKREIPEGWDVRLLNELTIIINRGIGPKYLDKGGIPVINQKCIRNKEIDFELARRHDLENKNTSKLIKQYDILVNSTGVGTLGRSAVVKYLVDQNVTVDSHVTIVRADQEKVNPQYLGFSITELQPYIEQLGVGSTGQTELSRTELGKLNIILPEVSIQSKFSKIIKDIWQKQSNNQRENQKLAELRDWLLPMLMNGQVTVKDVYNKPERELHPDNYRGVAEEGIKYN